MCSETRELELRAWLRDEIDYGTASGTVLGAGYQAVVRLYETPFGKVVVKSPHRHSLLGWIGAAMIRRESRVYERLRGIAGIPRSYGLIGDLHLVLEYIESLSLREHEAALNDRQGFYRALLRTLEAMHEAGVAHGDLKRKDNLLVAAGESPYIVDFGIASLCPVSAGRLNLVRFNLVRQMDYNAWIKLKYQRRLDDIAPEDLQRYEPLCIERLARWLRIAWQKLSLRRPRQRWRRRGTKGRSRE